MAPPCTADEAVRKYRYRFLTWNCLLDVLGLDPTYVGFTGTLSMLTATQSTAPVR